MREGVAGPLPRTSRRRGTALAAAAVLAGLLLARFVLAGEATQPDDRGAAPSADVQATVAGLQSQLRAQPDQPRLLTRLGVAYLSLVRQTADPSLYTKASGVLERSRELVSDDALTMTALGLLDGARHNFESALDWGLRAQAANPDDPNALGVITDAELELGRYDDASATVQRMVDMRPNLASLARASYVRELRGDVRGALVAMDQASAAGTGSGPDSAYARTLVGDIRLGQGALGPASAAYRSAIAAEPGYGAAEVGLARVEAARGDLASAARRVEPVAARLPLPATVALLGDVDEALGRHAEALRQYALVRAIEDLNRANGVEVDLELARFEADHGNPDAVDMARRALSRRPTVFAEDALGWALRQAGRPAEALEHARAAVRLGTRDALLWYHLAAAEADLGMTTDARKHLSQAFAINPYLTVRDLPAGRRLEAAL